MIEFMKSHYWDPYVAQYIRPKKEFKVRLKDADKEFVFDESAADLNKFDKLIDELWKSFKQNLKKNMDIEI